MVFEYLCVFFGVLLRVEFGLVHADNLLDRAPEHLRRLSVRLDDKSGLTVGNEYRVVGGLDQLTVLLFLRPQLVFSAPAPGDVAGYGHHVIVSIPCRKPYAHLYRECRAVFAPVQALNEHAPGLAHHLHMLFP